MPNRPIDRRLAPPPPAGIVRRRHRRKTDGAPPSQPKLSAAAVAEIFTARRGAVMIMVVNPLLHGVAFLQRVFNFETLSNYFT